MKHQFQLVLQLPADCPLESLDFEDDIAEALGNPLDQDGHPHTVDGNSCGAGTIEFFIHTDNPSDAFDCCKPLLESCGLLSLVTVAWCRFTDHEYQVIWPAGFAGKFRP
ncbi:MAG: hypothetical protein ACYTG0_42150 [Planctomycetota bacterium]